VKSEIVCIELWIFARSCIRDADAGYEHEDMRKRKRDDGASGSSSYNGEGAGAGAGAGADDENANTGRPGAKRVPPSRAVEVDVAPLPVDPLVGSPSAGASELQLYIRDVGVLHHLPTKVVTRYPRSSMAKAAAAKNTENKHMLVFPVPDDIAGSANFIIACYVIGVANVIPPQGLDPTVPGQALRYFGIDRGGSLPADVPSPETLERIYRTRWNAASSRHIQWLKKTMGTCLRHSGNNSRERFGSIKMRVAFGPKCATSPAPKTPPMGAKPRGLPPPVAPITRYRRAAAARVHVRPPGRIRAKKLRSIEETPFLVAFGVRRAPKTPPMGAKPRGLPPPVAAPSRATGGAPRRACTYARWAG
jgi:hypothetical protein